MSYEEEIRKYAFEFLKNMNKNIGYNYFYTFTTNPVNNTANHNFVKKYYNNREPITCDEIIDFHNALKMGAIKELKNV